MKIPVGTPDEHHDVIVHFRHEQLRITYLRV